MNTDAKTAIITGAAGGLGRAIAVRLAKEAWQLALADIDAERAHETLALVEQAGGLGQVEQLDVAHPADWQALINRLRNQWPKLDLVVNNAGVCGAGDVGDFPLADWQWLLGVNLHGVIYGCHTCLPWLKENPRGAHIINTASIAGLIAAPSMAAYNVAKAGVVALSETLYVELATQGIGVSVLCPGFFQTELLEKGRFVKPHARQIAIDYMKNSRFSAETVAEAAVRAMQRKQFYVVVGRRARWLWRLKRSSPLGFVRLVSAGWKKVQDSEQAKVAKRG